MKKISLTVFCLAVISVLIAEVVDLPLLNFIAKPLIMLSLFAYYFGGVDSEERSRPVILAIIFSLAGDVLLMLDYFIPGLIAFLLAHVFYILAYRQHQSEETENALAGLQRIRLAFPIVLAGSGLVIILYPVLGDLRIPVMIYALVITVMVLNGLFRYGRTTSQSFWMVFFGAVLFMISDSVIALNKFLTPIENAGFIIMSTYSVAQLLIVRGLVVHSERS